ELKSEMDSGAALDAEGARKLEEQVKSNPKDLGARSSLLACYAAECGGMDAAERSRARLQHISWLAENHPDSGVLGTRAAMINVNDGPLPDAAGYQKVRQIWLDQLAKEKNQPQVLVNAVNFLRLGDFAKTEALALAARGHHPSSQIWLGNLYGLAVLGVTGIDLQSGLPAAAKPYVEFTSRARVMLAQTSDAKVLLSALSTITAGARTLQAAGQLPPGYSTVCEKMLERARTFYAAVSETCAVSPPVPEPQRSTNPSVRPSVLIPSTIRVGGTVMGAKIRKQPKPSYPDAAKIMNFQGRVRFSATIGKQGKVEDLELLSGAFVLYESARDAVRRWEYQPTTLNGDPVEVTTVIDVNYQLSN
ncbi:MAG: energy transducer TonB, partial [Bryobacteraceae bacterium]